MNRLRLTAGVSICLAMLIVAPLVSGSIDSATGNVVVVPVPASVAEGTNESDTQVIAFQERVGVVLPALPASVTSVPAGTVVNSYLLHFDPVASVNEVHQLAGTVTFSEPILDILPSAQALAATDLILGNPNTFYGSADTRQAEFTSLYPPPSPYDFVGFSGNTLSIDWRANTQADEVRVITQGTLVDVDTQPASDAASLIAAINTANSTAGADTITLTANIVLTGIDNTTDGPNGLPSITSEITINGGGFAIERDIFADACHPFEPTPKFRIFRVAGSGYLTLDNVTVRGGCASPEPGGGIHNSGTLTLTNSTLADNWGIVGGGIHNSGTMTITDSTLAGNQAQAGGGIWNGGTITITDSTLSVNLAVGLGGGIWNGGTITIIDSTLSVNYAGFGGGIWNGGTITIIDSTLSDNHAAGDGGGIHNSGTMTITDSTLAGNLAGYPAGGGIYNISGTVTITNSIVANSANGDCAGSGAYSATNNLATGGCAAGLGTVTNLGPLADNGGPTLTHALLLGSNAIDAGINCPPPDADQRGLPRPFDGDGDGAALCDIGAFELQGASTPNTAPAAANNGYSMDEDIALTIAAPGVLANDTDAEGDTLSAVLVSGPAHGSVTLNGVGSFTYTPNPDFNGTDSFTYKANDGALDSNVATVTITINAVNDAPVAANDGYSTDEDTPLTMAVPGVLANDSDADGDALCAAWESASGPLNGGIDLNCNGSFTYTPNPNFSGPDSFTYTASDGTADSNVATVNITVNRVNDVPVLTVSQPSVTVNEGDTASNIGTVSDVDGDYVLLTASPFGLATNNNDGTWSWSFSTTNGPAQSATIAISGDDGNGGIGQTTFNLTVNNVAPTANAGTDQTVNRNTSVALMGTWTDPAGSADNVYAWTWDVNGDAVPDTSGTASYGDTIPATTSFALEGAYTLTFSVTDKDGATGSDTLIVTVLNQSPVCTSAVPSVDFLWPPQHQMVPVTIQGITDPEGDPVVVTITSIFQDEPTNGTGDGDVSPDGQGIGTSTATLRAERAGDGNGRVYHVGFTVNDGHGGTCTGTVTVGVHHDQGRKGEAVDDGALYDSTIS